MIRNLQTRKYGKTRTNKKKNSHSLKRKNKKTRQFRKKRSQRRSKKHKQIIGGTFSSGAFSMPKRPVKTVKERPVKTLEELEKELYDSFIHGVRPPDTHSVSSFEEYKQKLIPKYKRIYKILMPSQLKAQDDHDPPNKTNTVVNKATPVEKIASSKFTNNSRSARLNEWLKHPKKNGSMPNMNQTTNAERQRMEAK